MQFKQNSAFVKPLYMIWGVLLIVELFAVITLFDRNDPTAFILAGGLGFGYLFLVMIALMKMPGSKRTIILGGQEASIKANGNAPILIRIPWVNAKHVSVSRLRGSSTVIIVDDEETVIWFYSSIKARKYVKSCCEALGIKIEKLPELSARCFYADFDKQISTPSHF